MSVRLFRRRFGRIAFLQLLRPSPVAVADKLRLEFFREFAPGLLSEFLFECQRNVTTLGLEVRIDVIKVRARKGLNFREIRAGKLSPFFACSVDAFCFGDDKARTNRKE